MGKVLIAGFGDVGKRLARLLLAQGEPLLALSRSEPEAEFQSTWQAVDLLEPQTLSGLSKDFDFVVYLPTPGARTEEAYQNVFVDGLQNLHTVVDGPNCHWVQVTSTGVYGQNQGEWVDETSATEPQSFSGKILREAEIWLHENAMTRATSVRLAGIYGPGRGRLLRSVVAGKPVREEPSYYTNRVHSEDCARLLLHFIELKRSGKPLEPYYIGVDDAPVSEFEVQQWLAEQLGCAPLPTVNEPERGQNKRCRNQLIKASGFEYLYPSYREGYLPMIKDYLENGNEGS